MPGIRDRFDKIMQIAIGSNRIIEARILQKALVKRDCRTQLSFPLYDNLRKNNREVKVVRKIESAPLFAACDDALRQTVELMKPAYLIGIGNFAFQRARWALDGTKICIGRISHPSPANPRANAGWGPLIEKELKGQGVVL